MKRLSEYLSLFAFAAAGFLILFAMTLANPMAVIPCAFAGIVALAIAITISAISESHDKK